jgi:Prenyltransferase and squalene oxidase repeat
MPHRGEPRRKRRSYPSFDALVILLYNQPMINGAVRTSLRDALIERQIPGAGWSYQPSLQSALEPTCLALLALRRDSNPARMRGLQFLLGVQNPNGSWSAFTGDDGQGSGLSALAVLALINNAEMPLQAQRGLKWLLISKGKESNWLWRWKFRTSDTHVRFDPDKFGWPWMPATCSWVIPTAFSIVALKQAFVCCKTDRVSFRIRRGVDMLLDRACPGGGWNAGNGVVYGTSLAPHLDATAIALLALCGEEQATTVTESLGWLECSAATCPAPWSLAWSILALDAYDRPIEGLSDRLCDMTDVSPPWDCATLALVILALDCRVRGNAFKVMA